MVPRTYNLSRRSRGIGSFLILLHVAAAMLPWHCCRWTHHRRLGLLCCSNDLRPCDISIVSAEGQVYFAIHLRNLKLVQSRVTGAIKSSGLYTSHYTGCFTTAWVTSLSLPLPMQPISRYSAQMTQFGFGHSPVHFLSPLIVTAQSAAVTFGYMDTWIMSQRLVINLLGACMRHRPQNAVEMGATVKSQYVGGVSPRTNHRESGDHEAHPPQWLSCTGRRMDSIRIARDGRRKRRLHS
ncbi:hypothetical protein F5I97DRAFT_677121 [Phlebopus sp. FC_14]|nr:hypothetical protein F5I97DRAFT_677121 [Phlebopus sp. FC_14]